MGLHNTAHYLKTKGRGTDTELVHMSKNELKGLQQLAMAHGGSLSINPETGLAEAGFLEQVLPVVAAAAATYFTAGAAAPALATSLGIGATASGILAGAGAGALISGGTAALQGKDAGKAALYGGLGGAIAGGMGAYAPTDAAGSAAAATQEAAVKGGTDTAVQSTTGVAGTGAPTGFTPPSTPMPPPTQAGIQAAGLPAGAARNAALDQLATGQGVHPEGFAGLPGQGLSVAPAVNAPAAQPTIYSGLGDTQKLMVNALPAAYLAEERPLNQVPGEQYDPNNPMRWRISNSFQGSTPVQPNPYYQANYSGYAAGGPIEQMSQQNMQQGGFYPQGQQEHTNFATPTQMPTSAEVINSGYDPKTNAYTGAPDTRFAAGGIAGFAKGAKIDLSDLEKMYAAKSALPLGNPMIVRDSDPATRGLSPLAASQYNLKKFGKKYNVGIAPSLTSGIKDFGGDMSDTAAQGGLSHLGGYSDGGRMLKGPGDGMSDSIPASIGGKQPARLADGEFVVPADVVSHLGNGSTDAGAKKLYSMMDKIRRARTGKKKQAPAVKADKFMPA